MKRTCLFVAALCCLGAAQAQEDPKDSCGGILELYEQGDVDAALEEAGWCVEALEQAQMSMQGEVFPVEIAGWKRQSLDQNKAMGMAMTEAAYNKDEQSITVSLMGGAGGGFLGSLAQMGMMAGGTRMRLGDYTGVAMPESGGGTVTVSLENGGTLSFQSSQAGSHSLEEFATAFPIGALDRVSE
ncbi:MAG: hypothetical protein H0V34_02760 [Gammaproteobacteria bacterium]|nr:hypothetical protein [Gammaproteobacteria bacterium]